MKKLLYLGFCLVLSMGVGCAITDYETITDNTQFVNAFFKDKDFEKGKAPVDGFVVDTDGKAHIIESSQVATLWPDGNDELLVFVDQAANGDRVLWTYNNFNTADQSTFHDDLFCNPDWSGCAVWTAQDSGTCDPAGGGCLAMVMFDGVPDLNCLGLRSLSVLAGTSRYAGECGNEIFDKDKDFGDGDARPSFPEILGVLNTGEYGEFGGLTGLFFDVSYNNTNIIIADTLVPMADTVVFWNPQRHFALIDMTNPGLQQTARAFNDLPDEVHNFQISHNGLTVNFNAKKIGEWQDRW
jgi:hypothetical protein